jgi:hypothetical protein
MRFRLSWVSLVVGLLVAALFLVPTASRLDVREVAQADGTVEKRLETGYISLGSAASAMSLEAPPVGPHHPVGQGEHCPGRRDRRRLRAAC